MNNNIYSFSNPLVSIIVPVYNSAGTLERCVNSIITQTYKNFELLLIDDGSTDCSARLCDQFCSLDIRIKCFHKQNGGVSSARQLGIENAKGEFWIHVDSDDWIEDTMLYDLIEESKRTNADIVMCGFYNENSAGSNKEVLGISCLSKDDILKQLICQEIPGALWNKLVHRHCYLDTKVVFPLGLDFGEDTLTSILLVKNSNKIAYISSALYHYNNQDSGNSLTHLSNVKAVCDRIKLIKIFPEYVDMNDSFNIKAYYLYSGKMAYDVIAADYQITKSEFDDAFGHGRRFYHRISQLPIHYRIVLYFATHNAYYGIRALLRLIKKIKNVG
ncbi:glycosyltransferase family 2 protein [Segatella bryantii]|uniref:glycosyltransferase family 2 protein n=1 Tax=Segatella bryantii TaxID=77095 RepID=UPI00088619BA|nr:glycosyltransferase family 2 protein [Segatella bryantii]SDM08967.1 Glycosyl transferase family 2 [Segatella bryantii]